MNMKDYEPLIYLDHAATTPCLPAVVEAMAPFWSACSGNPSSKNHAPGRLALQAVEEARASIAKVVGATPQELVWTSGVTEANNLAILGYVRQVRNHRRGAGIPMHVVTAATEHKSVLAVLSQLRREGVEVSVAGVDSHGRVSVDQIMQVLRPETVLVSLMWANNETGVIHPVLELAAECARRGVAFHTDAAQMLGKGDFTVNLPGLTLATFGAHKLGGPKGIGALYVRDLDKVEIISPIIHGGGQERGLRSGTLNVPLIVGFGTAVVAAAGPDSGQISRHLAHLRDTLEAGILSASPGARVNGADAERVCHISSITLPIQKDGVEVVQELARVACSSGSACASHDGLPSHVLASMGIQKQGLRSTLRLSVGMTTTEEEIHAAVAEIKQVVHRFC
jgi:cysteine desulfurase